MSTQTLAPTPDAAPLDTTALLAPVGWAPEDTRSATTILVDQQYQRVITSDDNLIVMPIAEALVTYPWVQELMFSLIDPDQDATIRRAFESSRTPVGSFTWVKPGAHITMPAQSFTVMTIPQERQFVHDVTVYGAGCVVDTLSGTAVPPTLTRGHHVSISETFVLEGATVREVSVERWGRNMEVHQYSRTRIDRDASLTSVSVATSGLRRHVDDSRVEIGPDAKAVSHSILFAPTGTNRTATAVFDLAGGGAQAEHVSRMVSDGGDIRNDNRLVASAQDVRGFLECDGLMLRDTGRIESVPSLDAGVDRAQLSHEASVGMIDDERIDYLMSTGLAQDDARDLIVRGFLDLGTDRMPESVRATVDRLVAAVHSDDNM